MSGSGAGDRPRPSTSGGEYHYSVPAPFMTPLGNPVALYGGPQMHLAHPPPGTFLDPNSTATHTGPPPHPATAFAGSSFTLPGPPHGPPSLFPSAYQAASRPVTAPNYYGAPVFGLGGMNGGGAPRLAAPLPLYPNGAGGGGGMIAPQARRMSLPSELKQPTPVFGYGAPGGEEGFESIREEGEHTPLGALGGSQEELVGGAEGGSR